VNAGFTWQVAPARVVRVSFDPVGGDTVHLEVTEENAEQLAGQLEEMAAAVRQCARHSADIAVRPYELPTGQYLADAWRPDGTPRCAYVWDQDILSPPGKRQCILPHDHTGDHGF